MSYILKPSYVLNVRGASAREAEILLVEEGDTVRLKLNQLTAYFSAEEWEAFKQVVNNIAVKKEESTDA